MTSPTRLAANLLTYAAQTSLGIDGSQRFFLVQQVVSY